MKEPFLNRIVVEGPIDVNRAHAGEVDALVCQKLLSVQLALQRAASLLVQVHDQVHVQ